MLFRSLIQYTYNKNDSSSWRGLSLTPPANSTDGFKLVTPLTLGKAGTSTDTLYFRYYVLPNHPDGDIENKIAFLTANNYGDTGIAYDTASVHFEHLEPVSDLEPTSDPESEPTSEPNPDPDPEPTTEPEPESEPTSDPEPVSNPEPESETEPEPSSTSEELIIPNLTIMDDTILEDVDLTYLDPLGVVAYAPETGVVTQAMTSLLGSKSFAAVVLSQWFILVVLAIFSTSFAVYFPLRRY